MEDSLNRNYVNISNRKFTSEVYNEEDNAYFSYKPSSGFWLSLEVKEKNYYSQWDREYREELEPDDEGNLHATIVKFKPTTYIMSPSVDKTILEGFSNFIFNRNLTPDQKRKLLVELVRTHKNRSDIENIICQIDLLDDLATIEEIFGGYKIGNEYPDETYDNLALNVKKAIRESFAGLEITAFALGMDEDLSGESIVDTQIYWSAIDPKYEETLEYFDMPSAVIFDTSCLDFIKEVTYPQEIKAKEGEDRED